MPEKKTSTKLKVNDNVVVMNGVDRGRRGKLLFVDKKKGRVVIEGINKKKKHVRGNQENPKGGVVTIEFPLHISNVLYFCDKCKKGVRLGYEVSESGKTRVCKSCGKSIDK
jgi:large subunit ribosomal protein L24